MCGFRKKNKRDEHANVSSEDTKIEIIMVSNNCVVCPLTNNKEIEEPKPFPAPPVNIPILHKPDEAPNTTKKKPKKEKKKKKG